MNHSLSPRAGQASLRSPLTPGVQLGVSTTAVDRIWELALGLVFIFPVLLFAIESIKSLSTPAPIWFEGPILGFLHNLRLGRLYSASALSSAPYSALSHTPLSYWLDYAIYRAAPDIRSLRALNIVATLACAALIVRLVRVESGRRGGALLWIGACVFLGSVPVFFWSQVARCPDSLSCLFALTALNVVRSSQKSLRRDLLLGAILALAILSKQTSAIVLGPVLMAQTLWLEQDWRSAARLLAMAAGTCGPVFAALQWLTHGGYFENIVGANLVEMSLSWWISMVVRLWAFWILLAGAVGLGMRRHLPLVHVWLLTSFLFGIVGVAKRGSDTMYFFDTCAALGIIVGMALAQRPEIRQSAAMMIVGIGMTFMCVSHIARIRDISPVASREYSEMIEWLRDNAALSPILADDASVPLALGQAPVWDDPFIFAEWAKSGKWDDKPMAQAIREKRYGAIVVTSPGLFWSRGLRREIAASYRLAKVFHDTLPMAACLYLPAKTAARAEFINIPPQLCSVSDDPSRK